jgi:hypothetical protein
MIGGVMGLTMGLAGGLCRRSVWRGVLVGLGALGIGGLAGGLASRALIPLFFRQFVPSSNDLLTPILIHAAIWAAIGAVGGLAFAIGMGRLRQLPAVVGGACLGALLATVFFQCLCAGLFPDSGSTSPVPGSSLVRLLAKLPATTLVALGGAWGILDSGSLRSARGSDS